MATTDTLKAELDVASPEQPRSSMSRLPSTVAGVDIDWEGVLRTLRLNPTDPSTQALLVICERYGLDPILKHVVLIEGRPYVTRDGLLHIAHKSGVFDGIEVVQLPELRGDHWVSTVSVYRKDMSRPITYPGRYPKTGKNIYKAEMSIKCAEAMALRRAFDVAAPTVEEQWDHVADEPTVYPYARPQAQASPDAVKAMADEFTLRTSADGTPWLSEEQATKAKQMADESPEQALEAWQRLMAIGKKMEDEAHKPGQDAG